MTDISLCRALNSRKMVLNLTAPLSRQTPISPYNGTRTQSQLDMRRKAEILQYRKNASSSRVSQYTSVMRGQKIITCNEDRTKPTPTSSCDVPGAVIMLRYDPAVPLYNYALNVDNYGKASPEIQEKFGYEANGDVRMTTATTATVASIATIDLETYRFNLGAPIGIYVSGTSASDISGAKITITAISIDAYYGDNIVCHTTATGLPISLTYDVSASTTFSAYQFVGNISANFVLPAQNDFAYDIKMTMTATNTSPAFAFGGVANISANSVVGCSVSPIVSGNNPFTISLT